MDKVSKNGPNKICGRQPFERVKFERVWSAEDSF